MNLKNLFYFILILTLGVACKNNQASNLSLSLFEFQNVHAASKKIVNDSIENFFSEIRPLDVAIQLRNTINPDYSYLQHLQEDLTFFSEKDKNKLRPILNVAEKKLSILNSKYKLPNSINLIKSKGTIYGPHTYYTRGNSIIIPHREIEDLKETDFSNIILHEVFHILSRYNPELKKSLYKEIGFTPLTAKLKIEENFNERILLNPDGINFKYQMSITINEERYEVIPIIYSKSDNSSTTDTYFENLKFELFPIRAKDGIWHLSSPEEAEKLNLKSHQNFYAQIGRNTDYIIHPDEILADNFILIINNRSGNGKRGNDILAKMRSILLKKG